MSNTVRNTVLKANNCGNYVVLDEISRKGQILSAIPGLPLDSVALVGHGMMGSGGRLENLLKVLLG